MQVEWWAGVKYGSRWPQVDAGGQGRPNVHGFDCGPIGAIESRAKRRGPPDFNEQLSYP